jgi:AcrR family transcriptional regulator
VGRWKPDARGRLISAALELYGERGFEQTTALDIAERAGVTERTYFRYFADKREVLFAGSGDLQDAVVTAIETAPSTAAPVEVMGAAMESVASLLDRDHARRRNAVIDANPSLQERELLKLATLADAAADALRRRGVAHLAAGLAAEIGVTVFKIGFVSWISDEAAQDFPASIRQALDLLRDLTAEK